MHRVRIQEGKEKVYRIEETFKGIVDMSFQKSMNDTKLQIQGAQKILS